MEATARTSTPNPAKALHRVLAPALLKLGAHGHPGISPVARFIIEFDGYQGLLDLIGGDLYPAASLDHYPLVPDQAELLFQPRVPGYKNGQTTSGELLNQAIEFHLDHRHPGWSDE